MTKNTSVSYLVDGDIAVAVVDRPPVNAIDSSVRAGLLEAVRTASTDPLVRALVIAARGRTFMSGADLSELGSAIAPPPYPEMLNALEGCAKPVVAALHGTPLGGGLEIAMACHYRCATRTTKMGMPEITLGILPGAGGTQRLPRLVGAPAALDMLLGGAPIDAAKALELGLIDEIVGDDIVAEAAEYARRLLWAAAPPRPTRSRPAPQLTSADIDAALARHARALKGRTTQTLVIEALRAAAESTFDEGAKLETRLSADSLEMLESRALRHVFFAERECGRIPGVSTKEAPTEFRSAAVIGAGTMGTGIAMALADAAIPTVLIERDQAALDRGLGVIRDQYASMVARGRINQATADARQAAITGKVGMEAARDADVVIEAVFEDFELKRTVLAQIDAVVSPQAIIASNTSSLSLGALSAVSKRPERVVGLHFFSPANVMRLLEIVRGAKTSEATILAGLTLAKKLRKIGVVVGDGFGFVGNRMMLDGYFREAELMLLQGVAPERIDAVMEKFGFAMGPNRVNDMAGIDVGTRVRGELAKREPREPPYHALSDTLTSLGRLGQKTSAGIYRYLPGDRTPVPDPAVAELTREIARQLKVEAREVSDTEIEQRCVLSLVNVAAQILSEGLAYRASDIDVIWTAGYGFPRWRGGPMFHADSLGLGAVVETIKSLARTGGGSYWNVAPLLQELAASGRTFAQWDRERGS